MALAAGIVFGLGLIVSQMVNPAKILNFLDVFGSWDPSLAFVMGGGLVVAFIGYRLTFARRQAPVLEPTFSLPMKDLIDLELVGGAMIFGVGWGIAGFCPGGAIPALGLGYSETAIFVAAVIAGIIVARAIRSVLPRPAPA